MRFPRFSAHLALLSLWLGTITPRNVEKPVFLAKICLFWLCFALFQFFWTWGWFFLAENGTNLAFFARLGWKSVIFAYFLPILGFFDVFCLVSYLVRPFFVVFGPVCRFIWLKISFWLFFCLFALSQRLFGVIFMGPFAFTRPPSGLFCFFGP